MRDRPAKIVMQDGAAKFAVGLVTVRHAGGVPTEDRRHPVHKHRSVAQSGVTGVRSLTWAVA